jgi:alpha-glucosidase
MRPMAAHDWDWWRRAVFYQVYPRSFQDSNGDGIGDLQGIVDRLDYLAGTPRSLGVDAIWLSPTFPSPMKDFGYDVSDYLGVHPDFGDLATMDRLIVECHGRGVRVLLDFVPNHTSDQHPWFVEARSSRTNPRRDWYVWRDARPGGGLPNNWRAAFGGPAWTFDERTGQYYLHSFLAEQPDLDWRNPVVVEAMHDVLRYWLRRGVDGFRIDVMGALLKHPELADNPPNPGWLPEHGERFQLLSTNSRNYPDVFEAVRGIRAALDEFPGSVSVGEVFGGAEDIARFYGGDRLDGLHLAFNFHFIHEREPAFTAWEAEVLARIVRQAELALPSGAQPCYAFGNHDRARFVSRHDQDGKGLERARAAAILLLTLRGTPFLYYGEEIGMADVAIPSDRLQDPARFHGPGRDPERTPMQWDASRSRGFSPAEPWLPFGPAEVNVAAQDPDPDSLLSLYRRAIRLRRQEPSLHSGGYRELLASGPVFAFERRAAGSRAFVVALNTGLGETTLDLPGVRGPVVLASRLHDEGLQVTGALPLPPLAARVIAVD